MSLRFSVLGPVRAWSGETELDLGAPQQRALLAILLINVGHPLSLREIVAVLWGSEPPETAGNLVHRYVGALRRLFEPGLTGRGASGVLVRGSGGYRLDVDPAAVDLLCFRQLRRDAEGSEPGRAAELLLDALELWHGPVASDLPAQVRTGPAFTLVDGERLAAVKAAAEHAPAAGGEVAERVLLVVRAAATAHPLDESLQARLMLVLAATGRQAEALEVFHATRKLLAGELGLDPGPELRETHERVLRQEAESASGTVDVPVERPAQLPPDLAVFAGRGPELALFPQVGDEPGPAAVVTVSGMGGAGKTTLAVHWAHRIAGHFPDGHLYIDLHGFSPSRAMISPADALHSFLEALGVPVRSIPASLEAQTALFRSLLAGRRVLVVLDNARDSEQVRPLLPGAPGCLTVVTSRHQLYDLVSQHGAIAITCEDLPSGDAVELLSRRIGAERVAREPAAAAQIAELAGRIPLTLAMVSARAAMNPRFSLAAIARELHEWDGSLDAFEGESARSGVRSVFDWSYRVLTPSAARMFRLFALHPGPECAAAAAASQAGEPLARARRSLAELLRANLIVETEPGRFGVHDLLRAYARELDGDDDGARERVLDHYLHTAAEGTALLFPGRERLPLGSAAPGTLVTEFRDAGEAAAWFDTERPVLIAAVKQNATVRDGYAWQLAVALDMYLDRSGSWLVQREILELARASALATADRYALACTERSLGFVEGRLGRWAEADRHLEHALELFAELGDGDGEARAHRLLAFTLNQRERHDDALAHYRAAARLYRAAGRGSGLAHVHNETGWTYLLLGDYPQALAECRRAVEEHRATGDRNGEAAAWDSVGYAEHHLGAYEQALISFSHALRIYRLVHDRYLEADTLVHIGDTHEAAGRPARAETSWREALAIFDDLGHPDARQTRDRLRRREVRAVA
ncbi:SARP family transcriptional regulator [Actinoplanes cyaneus]|uniref:SARP family transcriptional regulator n=1 Tax=Actinoplanes cyaneus TaxID=52696 RepID=A0A919IH08_9ACTN|nr:BTAD domain-containing putative transcriptional regulator [Actinoplanes cyaneus]MCW2136623.1 DNA-binding transcriptional activator of the SARP family [Actinoplanes cyaneus]GID64226.1 SARP family transcriptional regulator [Actinoplanes cyaneus]